ncbi:NAD-binding protein, partial [Burkholderia multivorans]|nr:NAD-binding protein [Burkholderia multivorans]
AEGQNLILAVALISIALNSVAFAAIDPALAWIRKRSAFARRLEARDDPLAALPMSTPQTHLTGQVVIVGYGKVGTRIARALDEHGIAYVVVEQNREIVEKLRAGGVAAVSGDAIEPIVLVQAHIARAGMLVVTLPDVFDVRQIVEISHTLNPTLEVVLCTNSSDEAALLASEGIGTVFMGETELARGMTEHVLGRMAKPVATSH